MKLFIAPYIHHKIVRGNPQFYWVADYQMAQDWMKFYLQMLASPCLLVALLGCLLRPSENCSIGHGLFLNPLLGDLLFLPLPCSIKTIQFFDSSSLHLLLIWLLELDHISMLSILLYLHFCVFTLRKSTLSFQRKSSPALLYTKRWCRQIVDIALLGLAWGFTSLASQERF